MTAMAMTLGTLAATDDEAVACLLQRSLYQCYESRLGQGARFGSDPAPFRLFPRVYLSARIGLRQGQVLPSSGFSARDVPIYCSG